MPAQAIVGMLPPITYVGLLAVEAVWPARQFPAIPRWRLVGVLFFFALGAVSTMTPLLLPMRWLAAHRLFDGSRLGVAAGTVAGVLATTFVAYFVHRALHRSSFLWRWIHQMHHASQRLDIASASIFHPFEMVLNSAVGIVLGTLVLGLDPLAASLVGYLMALASMIEHLNVRTPRWLGYIIQRPESHGIHHQLGVHAKNYAILPVIDMLFGTFANPASFDERVGFGRPVSYARMLIGRDVSAGS